MKILTARERAKETANGTEQYRRGGARSAKRESHVGGSQGTTRTQQDSGEGGIREGMEKGQGTLLSSCESSIGMKNWREWRGETQFHEKIKGHSKI